MSTASTGFALPSQDTRLQCQADGKVRHGNISEHSRHRCRGLLTCFHQEILPIALTVSSNRANSFDRTGVESIGGIFGDKTTVCLDLRYTELLGKVGGLVEGWCAGSACLRRYEANRGGALCEVPFERPRPNNLNRSYGVVMFREQNRGTGSLYPA